MVQSNSNNQFYTQYHTPRPTRIQTPRNNIIAHSIANKRRRDNQAKRKKEWNDVVRRVRANLNPTPVRTQRIKSTPRRVNTTQTPVNYNKIVKEAINESNAVKALLNLNRKPDANKEKAAFTKGRDLEKKRKYMREYYHKKKETMTEAEKEAKRQYKREWQREWQRKKRASMTEANREKTRKQKREWARKSAASMTEAEKEAKRQHKRELYRKRVESMTEANKQKKAMTPSQRDKKRKYMKEWTRKRAALMTEADKEAKRQYQRELYRKKREKHLWSYGII